MTDVYLDDAEWTCRYLVVKTGSWLNRRQVLITPHAVHRIDWARAEVDVALSRDQIRRSPDIEADKPISRQKETSYFDYYRVEKVSWSESGVFLDLTKEQVRNSPQHAPTAELTAENEAGLYAHYRRSPQHHAGPR